MKKHWDFSGWATRNNIRCSDGRTIIKDAFKDNDGKKVPLVWNHQHTSPDYVIGHAMLENRDDGVYAYGYFNDTTRGKDAKTLVSHGDIVAMSIYANRLKQNGDNVIHGAIREVSLVFAGANPGAYIDSVIEHDDFTDEEAIIYSGEDICIRHSDDNEDDAEYESDGETVAEVLETMNAKQKNVLYYMVGKALVSKKDNEDDEDEGGNDMKHNLFENETEGGNDLVLTHSDQVDILAKARSSTCGTLKGAIEEYVANIDDELKHGFDEGTLATLFPEPHDLMPGAPEAIPENNGWISKVMSGVKKSPFGRIRTRQADISKIKAGGYKTKGSKKKETGNVKLVTRTTDPQTVYIKDKLNRDDIVDITDFDVVAFQYGNMKFALNEEIATAIMIGDGRDSGDEQKIEETHIRPIWTDDDLYAIHADVDIKKAKAELQGTNTAANFGDNYVYAEAILTAALYAREQYKGAGSLTLFCTPHLLNVMLLARDMNGRRIYSSRTDLAAALNVREIVDVEAFDNKTRKTTDPMPKTKKLLGIFVNLADYTVGAVKGGEIAKFDQFDIDFNVEKYLIETRLSGALTRVKSAIVLEEDVTPPEAA